MCTSIALLQGGGYFGRNLDLEYSFGEQVVIMPRLFPLHFHRLPSPDSHFSMIGMANVAEGYPLYAEAVNEKGLYMAGLNFPGNADYKEEAPGRDNITPFEFIPWLLGQCAGLRDARLLLSRINLVNIPFSEQLPLSPLHWMISDPTGSIVVESLKEGLKIYENPIGVMTNNPPFDYQLFHLNNFMQLSKESPRNSFADGLDLQPYCLGMGAMGLPGDLSSASRFVKAAFTKLNSVSGATESESVSQFFHILGSVSQQRGCVHLGGGRYEITIYSSCCNMDKGIYYYTTYENSQISAVDMHRENLDGSKLVSYPLRTGQSFCFQN